MTYELMVNHVDMVMNGVEVNAYMTVTLVYKMGVNRNDVSVVASGLFGLN